MERVESAKEKQWVERGRGKRWKKRLTKIKEERRSGRNRKKYSYRPSPSAISPAGRAPSKPPRVDTEREVKFV